MTPEQRRRNRRTGLLLALFVAAVLVWTFLKGSQFLGQ
ncbi:cytochrome oxidase small assembly protein [Alcaligenes sp. WGS1538]